MSERVLVVMPAYNEEASIADVLERLRRVAPGFDRIVVNDGSTDGTGAAVEKLAERELRLPCNLGYGKALQAGLCYGLDHGYDIVVSLDADGQHDPSDVVRVVDALRATEADVVIGSRFGAGRPYGGPLNRRAGQILFSLLTRWLLGQRIYDTSSGLKAMRASACEAIVGGSFADFHIEVLVRLRLLRFQIVECPIEAREREAGVSMHSASSSVTYPLKTLVLTVLALVDGWLERRRRDGPAR